MTEHEAKCLIIEYRPIVGFEKYREALNMAMQALEEVQEYRAIGTVEEFKALKEKNEPKKMIVQRMISYCPTCKERLYAQNFNVGYCNCGQSITV